MTWWIWLVIGLGLVGVELMTPGGFYVIFFGAAALVTGLAVRFAGLGPAGQWLLFAAISVASLLLFRKPLMRRFGLAAPGPPVDSMVGELCTVVQSPGADGFGKVELRGTSWTARASAGGSFAVGQRCRVERVDGLTLWIGPQGGSS